MSVLTARVALDLSAVIQKTLDLSLATDQLGPDARFDHQFSNGVDDDEADVLWHDARTVAKTVTDDLDLAGSLINALGDAANFAVVRAIIILNIGTVLIHVKPGSANGFGSWIGGTTPYIIVPPGGSFVLTCPTGSQFTVTASTGDILSVYNPSGSTAAGYRIVLIGTSA